MYFVWQVEPIMCSEVRKENRSWGENRCFQNYQPHWRLSVNFDTWGNFFGAGFLNWSRVSLHSYVLHTVQPPTHMVSTKRKPNHPSESSHQMPDIEGESMLVQAQSIIVRMITIIWWQQWRSWWWLGWWWWLAPNIDGDGMLLQVQDRKYWSRPTPTTMCTTCNTVQKYKLFCTLTITKKYKIFCTPCTNIYKKVQNILHTRH